MNAGMTLMGWDSSYLRALAAANHSERQNRKGRCVVNVQIRDREALSSISIVNIRAYLNSHGWTDAGTWGERAITIFAKEHGGRTWEILVPHRDTIGGYAENMDNSVAVLSAVEERSELDVFYDLADAGS